MSGPLETRLVESGRVARLETRGRRSGDRVAAVVGFVEEPDGSILVAAGDPGADWARNLVADARCTVTVGEITRSCVADELAGDDRSRAIRALILRYGTPSERLGSGPAFRLRPIGP